MRIIIPTRGANAGLEALLTDLDRELQSRVGAAVAVSVEDRGANAAENRNLAAREASEEWFQFIDDDVRLPHGWLEALLNELEAPDVPDLLGGDVRSQHPHNWFSQAAEDFVVRHKEYPEGWYLVSAHLAVKRAAFAQLGGFDEGFASAGGEDWDLCRRAHALGLRVGVSDAVVCMHDNPRSWSQLVARAHSYGRANASLDEATPAHAAAVTAEAATERQRPAERRPTTGRALRWAAAEYRSLRRRGRGPVRALRSTALYVPWMATYLRSQRNATVIIAKG